MTVTINDILPVSLCLATEELFDARRFKTGFGDNINIREKDMKVGPRMTKLKRELNSMMTEQEFLKGYKVAILGNMDRILALAARYTNVDLREVEGVLDNGKAIMDKVIFAENFNDIAKLEPEFKAKVMLPVYSLFIKVMRSNKVSFL